MKREITCFKKNIDVFADREVARSVGQTLENFVGEKFRYLTRQEIEVSYWMKSSSREDEDGQLIKKPDEAIFCGMKIISDEINVEGGQDCER